MKKIKGQEKTEKKVKEKNRKRRQTMIKQETYRSKKQQT